jgi:hypothetical protein
VCPVLQARFGFGLKQPALSNDQIIQGDYTVFEVIPGLGLGLLTTVNSTIDIAPFAHAAILYRRSMLDAGDLDVSGNDTSGLIQFGARALFNGRLSLGPTMSVPIAAEGRDGDITFGFSLSVAVGG